jgi:hypothetical protein
VDRRFKSSDWLIVTGGLVVLFASVLPWWDWSNPNAPGISQDGYDFALTGILPIALLLVVVVVTVTIKTDSLQLPDWLVHPYVTTTAVVVAAALLAVRFTWSGYENTDNVSRGLGMYLAAAGVVIALLGCALAIRDLRTADAEPADDLDDDDDLVDDDDDEDADDVYGYADYAEEDDLVRRINTHLTTGETPVHRPTSSGPPPRRTPSVRQPAPRRRPPRDVEAAPRPRPKSPPLP